MFKYTYLELGDFFSNREQVSVNSISDDYFVNDLLIKEYKLDKQKLIEPLSGRLNYDVNLSYAQSYAGHQFSHLAVLGDGRSTMLGEIEVDDKLYDIQFKGSGATKFSRGGDGKLTHEAALKELLYGEALHGLNIDTTRTLSIYKTKEKVIRSSLEDGALLSRFAKSHIRIASFYNAFYFGNISDVTKLADYSINRHYPLLKEDSNKYRLFYQEVIKNQADLMSSFQAQGFVHGVLNTDNVTISGQAIDFGPCAFLDKFKFDKVFSSIDRDGRYAFNKQKEITIWNLTRLGEALSELFNFDSDDEIISFITSSTEMFSELYDNLYYEKMINKLGGNVNREDVEYLLELMNRESLNYHNVFKFLTYGFDQRDEFSTNKKIRKFSEKLKDADKELMILNNPCFILSNVIFDYIIANQSYVDKVLTYLQNPFEIHEDDLFYYLNSLEDITGYTTYCNT